jgi:hypothetical protein
MRPSYPLPPHAEKKLTQLLEQAAAKADYRRVLCVWLRVALGMSAAEMATVLGWSPGTVHNRPLPISACRRFDLGGVWARWKTPGVIDPSGRRNAAG